MGDLREPHFELKRGNSYLFVGQPPKDFQLPVDLKTTTLAGGFNRLIVDGRRVGLYDALVSTVDSIKPPSIKRPPLIQWPGIKSPIILNATGNTCMQIHLALLVF